jgi:release factor glutamine methyltransferase
MTVQAAQTRAARLLAGAGIDTPALDSSLLLAEALGLDRERLILAYPGPLPEDAARRFEELLRRRLAGESAAYILGRREFWGLEFTVSPAVLVPRPDTETLVEAALPFLASPASPPFRNSAPVPAPRTSALDLCTGSGAVAIALKHEAGGLEVWASDSSPDALEIARHNAARLLGNAGKAEDSGETAAPGVAPITFVLSDLFEQIPRRFSLITANPPYVKSAEIAGLSAEVRGEPRIALDGGADGLDLIRRLIAEAPAHLYPGGGLFLEADSRQMKTIRAELEKTGFAGIQTYRDLSGAERVIGGIIKPV